MPEMVSQSARPVNQPPSNEIVMGYVYCFCPLTLVAVSAAFWIWPPKKINMTYGYRTTRSMKSQSAWDFAQKYSAKWMTVLGGISLALAAGACWLRGSLGLNPESVSAYDIGICVLLPIVATIPVIVMTEFELRKRFG